LTAKATEKKQLILDTTKIFILEYGLNDLTLERIAANANISKGGLLYHFPNKLALMEGLTEKVFSDFIQEVHLEVEQDTEPYGKWSRALIIVSEKDLKQNAELNVGILSSSILDETNVSSVLQQFQQLFAKLDDDHLPATTATIIRLTLDGLYYNQIFNIAPVEKKQMDKVIENLLSQTYPGVES